MIYFIGATIVKLSSNLYNVFLCGCGGMVDTLVLGASAERRGSSSLLIRTIYKSIASGCSAAW